MVLETENPNFKLASCCKVDVVNGAAGFLVAGFIVTASTLKFTDLQESNNAVTSSSDFNCLETSARILPFSVENTPFAL